MADTVSTIYESRWIQSNEHTFLCIYITSHRVDFGRQRYSALRIHTPGILVFRDKFDSSWEFSRINQFSV